MDSERIRCRKCRCVLLSEDNISVLDAHGEEYYDTVGSDTSDLEYSCSSLSERSCLYLSEEAFPDFILKAVDESSWTKGKIYCPSCQARLGSFNFVSGGQCACGSHVLPQVHILRSKVDWIKVSEALPHPVSFPDHSVVLCAASLPLEKPVQISKFNDSDLKEDVGPNIRRNVTDLPWTASTTSQDTNSFRSQRKELHAHEKSGCKVRHRQQGRKKLHTCTTASPESSDIETAKSSCFEMLNDEVTTTEGDSNLEEEEEEMDVPDNLVCPVCLDVLYSPLVTKPCGHIFCEPCLRRMAQPNPTGTHCPLCREIIGHCMPCPDLAHEVQKSFSSLYQKRRQFELQHNSQHLPLPWIRNFRLRNAHNSGESWVERAGGWRTIMMMMSLNILCVGIILYLGKAVKIQADFKMA